jgi:UDP-galactopyranose mutase
MRMMEVIIKMIYKLNKGALEGRPNRLELKDGRVMYFNIPDEVLKEYGYKELKKGKELPPKAYFKIKTVYNQDDNYIYENYEYEKMPKPDREKLIDEKMGSLYDLSRQITIIAMKDKDAETFKKYEESVEKCIKEADMEIARWMEVHEPTTFQKLKQKIWRW